MQFFSQVEMITIFYMALVFFSALKIFCLFFPNLQFAAQVTAEYRLITKHKYKQ